MEKQVEMDNFEKEMVIELEKGRPKMKDKLESSLRGMRLEEMRAI